MKITFSTCKSMKKGEFVYLPWCNASGRGVFRLEVSKTYKTDSKYMLAKAQSGVSWTFDKEFIPESYTEETEAYEAAKEL